MFKAFLIAKREYISTVKTKGFLITILLAPILFSGSGIAIALLKDKVDTKDKKVAIIDHSGILGSHLIEEANKRNEIGLHDPESGKKVRPAYLFEIYDDAGMDSEKFRLELSNMIRDEKLHAFLEIDENVLHPGDNPGEVHISYYSKNSSMDAVRSWIDRPINMKLRKLRLKESGVDEAAIADVLLWFNINAMGLSSFDEETGDITEQKSSRVQAVLLPIIMGMLLYMMILMGALPLLNSVMEEKMQRIAEVMLGSVKPFDFMVGKVIGGVGVSLTAAMIYVVGGVIAVNSMGYANVLPYEIIPWFFVHLILAITMFGSINAALGASCNDPKDAQSFTFVALLPVIFSLFLMFPILEQPLTGFATAISLIPIFTPIVMLVRMTSPLGIPAWQPWVGLAGMVTLTIFAIWASGRIFRVGILMSGKPPKFRNLMKWMIKG